ncbi:MAG: hypothetical protein WA842_13015, partial [Croceibacterium sp.]
MSKVKVVDRDPAYPIRGQLRPVVETIRVSPVQAGPMETAMKHSLLAAAAAAAAGAIALSGCVSDDPYGPPRGYADVEYGGYYDGFYGPFSGGYWGPSGLFYYFDHGTGRYHRDSGHHFRREGAPGFDPIHGRAPPAASRGRPNRPGPNVGPSPSPGPGPG